MKIILIAALIVIAAIFSGCAAQQDYKVDTVTVSP